MDIEGQLLIWTQLPSAFISPLSAPITFHTLKKSETTENTDILLGYKYPDSKIR